MRKIMRFAAPALVAMMMVPQTSHAATTQTWTYVAAVAVSCGGSICSPQVPGANLAPLGAFQVTPSSTTITYDVDDVAGTGNEVSFCQENAATGTDAANLCGDGPDDVSVGPVCATGGSQTAGGFKAGNPVLVSLFSVSLSCEGIGTTGTAKVTF